MGVFLLLKNINYKKKLHNEHGDPMALLWCLIKDKLFSGEQWGEIRSINQKRNGTWTKRIGLKGIWVLL